MGMHGSINFCSSCAKARCGKAKFIANSQKKKVVTPAFTEDVFKLLFAVSIKPKNTNKMLSARESASCKSAGGHLTRTHKRDSPVIQRKKG